MSQVSLLIPIFGVFFSYVFLQEKFYSSMLISLILLIVGLSILQKSYKVIKD
jgi:drug/metabolite transporter (DMT)-like permease